MRIKDTKRSVKQRKGKEKEKERERKKKQKKKRHLSRDSLNLFSLLILVHFS